MGTGFPRLHRQLASAAAVLAIWLALAPHARADLLPATPVAPVAAATASTVAASVTDVTNIVATAPAAELAKAAPVIARAAEVAPTLRPVVSPAVQRLSAVVAPVVAVVRSVSAPPAAITAPTTIEPAVRLVTPIRPKHRTPARAARVTGTAVPVRTQASPHRVGRVLAAFSVLSSPTNVARTPWLMLVFGPDTGPIGSAAASGGGAAVSSPGALRPVSWLLGQAVLVRFAAPNQVPRSTTLLLQLERPG